MNTFVYLILSFMIALIVSACSHQSIQRVYWESGTSVAYSEEESGNLDRAETQLKIALGRAKVQLGEREVADSMYNLGAFYRRQHRTSDAIFYLQEALLKEEALSGPQSSQTGRILAELSASYLMEENYFEGRPLAVRLEPLAKLFTDNNALFIDKILKAYAIDFGKYEQDVRRLKKLADSGDSKAQYELANLYFDGPEAKRLLPEILNLYKSAALQGNVDAQHYLGVLYDKGRGVARDAETARYWLRMAAESGHPIGQWNYAVFLMEGMGGPKDENQAIDWIKKSAAQGHPSAQRYLQKSKWSRTR